MKALKLFSVLAICITLLLNISSCIVFVKKDNGKHKGWDKNPNNPHHPNSTNPGKSKGKPKKSKGNAVNIN